MDTFASLLYKVTQKYRFFYIVFALFSLTAYPTSSRRARKKMEVQHQVCTNVRVIAWDLHDVLFFGKPSFASSFWKHPHKRRLMPSGKMRKIIAKEARRSLGGSKKDRLNSTKIISAARKYGCPDIADFIIQNEIACAPAPEMFSLIKDLYERGYVQYLCSNISEQGIAILKEKYPEFFSYFKDTYTTRDDNSRKPYISFFTRFLNTYNLKGEEVLFVDDKFENCVSANKVGMRTICFKKGSNRKEREKLIQKIYALLETSTISCAVRCA